MEAEKIADGYGATAGPVFSRRSYLLFSDVPSKRILKWEKGKLSVFRENSNGASGNTFDHQGRLLTCETREEFRILRLTLSRPGAVVGE